MIGKPFSKLFSDKFTRSCLKCHRLIHNYVDYTLFECPGSVTASERLWQPLSSIVGSTIFAQLISFPMRMQIMIIANGMKLLVHDNNISVTCLKKILPVLNRVFM